MERSQLHLLFIWGLNEMSRAYIPPKHTRFKWEGPVGVQLDYNLTCLRDLNTSSLLNLNPRILCRQQRLRL
jgi:hypothetical protein